MRQQQAYYICSLPFRKYNGMNHSDSAFGNLKGVRGTKGIPTSVDFGCYSEEEIFPKAISFIRVLRITVDIQIQRLR